ncbi:hypothetical protein SNK04_014496 [Fusarium graminearum]
MEPVGWLGDGDNFGMGWHVPADAFSAAARSAGGGGMKRELAHRGARRPVVVDGNQLLRTQRRPQERGRAVRRRNGAGLYAAAFAFPPRGQRITNIKIEVSR